MRKLLVVVVACFVASSALAATVVLKGGKSLQVENFQQDGNLLVLRYPDGRLVSYPIVAVDMEATQAVNEPPPPAAEPEPVVPRSPFFGAQAPVGEAAVTMNDSDVAHIPDAEGDELAPQESGQEPGQVVIAGYQKRLVDEGIWEVAANVVNQGNATVSNIVAAMNLLDASGELLGSGNGTFGGTLAPGQQGVITAAVPAAAEPFQITFSLRWQALTAVPAPPASADVAPPPSPEDEEDAGEPTEQQAGGYTTPAGSSPVALPSNPLAIPDITAPPYPPQIPRSTESSAGEPG